MIEYVGVFAGVIAVATPFVVAGAAYGGIKKGLNGTVKKVDQVHKMTIANAEHLSQHINEEHANQMLLMKQISEVSQDIKCLRDELDG